MRRPAYRRRGLNCRECVWKNESLCFDDNKYAPSEQRQLKARGSHVYGEQHTQRVFTSFPSAPLRVSGRMENGVNRKTTGKHNTSILILWAQLSQLDAGFFLHLHPTLSEHTGRHLSRYPSEGRGRHHSNLSSTHCPHFSVALRL
ncbi:hypothetical protein TRVL_07132 [Trypanosoma vivax]|nr:hypothetical protein TRVL_07132 [Trypanosoma vivax]